VATVFGVIRLVPVRWASAAGGALARMIGPLIPRSAIARENLKLAFPEKSAREREAILRGVWDNLGRTALEYPHLDHLWNWQYQVSKAGESRIDVEGLDTFLALKASGKPAIIFTAHLANWELLAVCAARYALPISVFFREPNNPYVRRLIARLRGQAMGDLIPTDFLGALAAERVLAEGRVLGLLADQHFSRGPAIPFFGSPARTAPTLAKLALRFECAVHGARVVRLPGGRFRVSITGALPLPKSGTREERIAALLASVNRVIESWVREHPEQWLWLHRRWRD
jgi:KDO2-lipid IV(A) lauroyltransferase